MIIPGTPEQLAAWTDEEVAAAYVALGYEEDVAKALTRRLRAPSTEVVKAQLPKDFVVSVESARDLAESVGHTELLAEVEKSVAAGVSFLKLGESDTGDLVISEPLGVMIGFFLDPYPSLKVQGGTTDPHITLCYLGMAESYSLAEVRQIIGITAEVAQRHTKLRGVVKGTGYFEESGAWFARPHVPGLETLRADLKDSLEAAGIQIANDYEFNPHITLAYTAEPPSVDVAPFEVYLSQLTVAFGSFRYDTGLREWEKTDYPEEPLVDYRDEVRTPFVPVIKASEEKRFTLAPMYVPGSYDSQGDWATADDLQEAVWKFNRGDRLIALQHRPDLGAMGEAVEMMVIPWEHTVPLFKADGTSEDHTFPAGTPWLGVIWNENVWPLVKAGKVRGYSIGGRANLVDVQLPEADVAKAVGPVEDA